MPNASRRKGQAGELEFLKALREADPEFDGQRRLDQTRDGGHDVEYLGYVVEVKRHRKPALTSWYHQALAQAGDQPAAVAFRIDREAWRVMPVMSVTEFARWAKVRQYLD